LFSFLINLPLSLFFEKGWRKTTFWEKAGEKHPFGKPSKTFQVLRAQ
jgi:hypothetical protein